MFGWLKKRTLKNFSKMQREELQHFLDMLKGVDDTDMGLTVVYVANVRNELRDMYDFNDLIVGVGKYSSEDMALSLINMYQQLQQSPDKVMASGVAVWLHTIRTVHVLENRFLAREMWKELRRGFDYAEGAAIDFYAMTGETLNVHGYDKTPVGYDDRNRSLD